MKKIETFLDKILNQESSFWSMCTSICVVIMVRIILENFSNPFYTGNMSTFITMISFYSFFSAVFLSIGYVLYFFTKISINKIFNIVTLISLSILIPPAWDLITTGGHNLGYTTETGLSLVKIFFTMGSHAPGSGISWGVRVAVITTLIISFIFIKQKTRFLNNRISSAFVCTIAVYIAILTQGAWLSTIGTLAEIFGVTIKNQGAFWLSGIAIKESFFATHHGVSIFSVWDTGKTTESFSLFMMRLHIISIAIVGWFIIKSSLKNIHTWFSKILPWKRIFMFIFFAVIGMVLADKLVFIKIFTNPVNISGFIVLSLGFVFHGITAIIVNDISDYELDRIAHPERPLPSGLISVDTYKNIGIITCILGILSTISINYTVTIFLLGVQALYYIYTVNPLRLKRHWLNGFWIYTGIGLCVLSVGYFFTSTNQTLLNAPWNLFIPIAFVFSITAFQKDIPDAFADKQFGINSFPVFMGERAAIIISTIITPVLFGFLSYLFRSWALAGTTTIFTVVLIYKVFNFMYGNSENQSKKLTSFVNTYIIFMMVFFLCLVAVVLTRH
jgi:geranylgeranylglycerol-phosphate geranylgeranyltransferase